MQHNAENFEIKFMSLIKENINENIFENQAKEKFLDIFKKFLTLCFLQFTLLKICSAKVQYKIT